MLHFVGIFSINRCLSTVARPIPTHYFLFDTIGSERVMQDSEFGSIGSQIWHDLRMTKPCTLFSLSWKTSPSTTRNLLMSWELKMMMTRNQIPMSTSCLNQVMAESGLSKCVKVSLSKYSASNETFPDPKIPDGALVKV
jgi:hypothetical protein